MSNFWNDPIQLTIELEELIFAFAFILLHNFVLMF